MQSCVRSERHSIVVATMRYSLKLHQGVSWRETRDPEGEQDLLVSAARRSRERHFPEWCLANRQSGDWRPRVSTQVPKSTSEFGLKSKLSLRRLLCLGR
jgi:hypothetical protein